MTIILPDNINPNDPVVQQAMQQEMEQAKMMQVINAIKTQLLCSIYAQLTIDHAHGGQQLTLETGRELALRARKIENNYAPFLFESLGMAELE